MFEGYTEKSRRVIFFARYEASQTGSPCIETEHLLLALMREANASVSSLLHSQHYKESIWKQIQSHATIREKTTSSLDLPFSNECARVLNYAAEEASRPRGFVAPGHLLLGILREPGCFAARMLTERGAELESFRKELAEPPHEPPTPTPQESPLQRRGLFERFTQRATSAIVFARYEVSRSGSAAFETEHLFLGLVHEDKPAVDRLLGSDISEDSIRKEIQARTTIREKVSTSVDIPLSNECKRVLAYAAEEAERLGHEHIGTEHLLLGFLREENCVAAQMLRERGANLAEIRKKLSDTQPPA